MNICNIIILNLSSSNFWFHPKIKKMVLILSLIAFATIIVSLVYLLGYLSCFEKCIFIDKEKNNVDLISLIGEGSIFLSIIILCIIFVIFIFVTPYLIIKYCINNVYPLLIQYPRHNIDYIDDIDGVEWNI